METKHLSYFKVENFKRFDSLEVNDIGQFNLIVGDNNVGKTTLLEALLFDDENYNQCLRNIWAALNTQRHIEIPDGNTINYLDFYLNDKSNPLKFTYKYGANSSPNNFTLAKRQREQLSEAEINSIRSLILLHGPAKHLVEFIFNNTPELKFITYGAEPDSFSGYIPLVSFNAVYGDDLVEFFSKISIDSLKLKNIVTELKDFIPDLESIENNNALVPKKLIIAVRESNKDLRPLSQYGDGVIKLFRYLLELELCTSKRLMVDEIDTGIHYSRMKDFLMKVLQSAKNKNVQIFATTHSKECIEYYTEALKELGFENDGRIIRIADTQSGIKAYTMNYEEFESALNVESEIR